MVDIVVVGLGYIGLPTAVTFASHGQIVHGVDCNMNVIDALTRCEIPIDEPGLSESYARCFEKGFISVDKVPKKANVYIIAVPTPNKKNENRSCDINYVIDAVVSILPYLENGATIIIESTLAPLTMIDSIKPLIENSGFIIGEDIFLVHCPERVLPGNIMEELITNNRIIGGITENCTKKGKEVYGIFVKGELLETDASSAEMAKLMENTFRDVNIALANELAKVSRHLGLNAIEIIRLANKHPRVNLHTPGPGVGGHCLAVDPYFISSSVPEASPLIQTARSVNSTMPDFIYEEVMQLVQRYDGKKIAVLGLSYKGNTNDIRESPAMAIYEQLKKKTNYTIKVYDPCVVLDFVEDDIETTIFDSDLVLILTDHSAFNDLKPSDFENMRQKNVFDTRNILRKETIEHLNYYHMGRFLSF